MDKKKNEIKEIFFFRIKKIEIKKKLVQYKNAQ